MVQAFHISLHIVDESWQLDLLVVGDLPFLTQF